MSDWFLKEEEVEYTNKSNGFNSPLYRLEEIWIDKEWVQKVLDYLINPKFIIITTVLSLMILWILGGYNA